jgi:hypothetical protein
VVAISSTIAARRAKSSRTFLMSAFAGLLRPMVFADGAIGRRESTSTNS